MKKARLVLATGVSLSVLSLFVSEARATMDEATRALKSGDYEFALQEFGRLATKENNAEAMYQLGRMHETGTGVDQNEAQAEQYYKSAAARGHEKALLKIGNLAFSGRDFEKAFTLFENAAKKGNYTAQYNLGLMYEKGNGVKKDPVKAFEYYKKSGEQGYEPAQYVLGRLYLKGDGTPQNFTAAIKWYRLAANQGDENAQMDLADLYANTKIRGLPFNPVGAHLYYNIVSAYSKSPLRDKAIALRNKMAAVMKPEDIQQAQSAAQRWKKKSRMESIPSMQDMTGVDDGSVENVAKKTSSSSDKEEIRLSVNTDKETMLVAAGVSRWDLSQAVRNNDFKPVLETLTPKAESGDLIAQLALGDLYVLGQGMDANPEEALKWYNRAAESKNAIAYYKIGPMYCEGTGVEPDLATCYMYFLLAKKYSDEASAQTIEETIKMLDANFGADIIASGKKMFEDAEKAEQTKNDKIEPKKGLFSNLKEKLFNGSDDDDDDGSLVVTDKTDQQAKEKAIAEEKAKKEEKKKKEIDSADDFFSDF